MQDHIPRLQNRTETHEQDCEIGLRKRIMEQDCGIRLMRGKKNKLSKTLLIYHVGNAFILSNSQYTYYRDNPPEES